MSFETRLGEEITHTCERAVKYAEENNEVVEFDFNGVTVVVAPNDKVDSVVGRWNDDFERNVQIYRNSQEGQLAALETIIRREVAQQETNDLMESLPAACENVDLLVKWCVELSETPDSYTKWNPQLVADVIEGAGYEENKHVGQPPEAFEDDPQMTKEWILGQCVNCLRMGMPPHGVVHSFAERVGL